MSPHIQISAAVPDSANPRALATFYERLLGWTKAIDEPARPGQPPEDGWVMLRPPTGGPGCPSNTSPTTNAPSGLPAPTSSR